MYDILAHVICAEYYKNFLIPNWKLAESGSPILAMDLEFGLRLDYDREEGFRRLRIRIMNRHSYVSVYAKLSWEVAETGSSDYVQGETPWVHFSAHDCCWTSDGVESILRSFKDDLTGIGGFEKWYQSTEIPEELYEEFTKITEDTRKGILPHSRHFKEMAFTFPAKG